MSFRSDLRFRTSAQAKMVAALLTLLLFAVLAAATISGFLVYRIIRPQAAGLDLSTERVLGNPVEAAFSGPGGGKLTGWFYPGRRGAPTIVLCHGYQSNRAEILTLAAGLQENRFNVFLFDFSGHGRSPGRTSLGYTETEQLRAAIQGVAQRDDVDPQRFGVWGTNLGAYAALAAAPVEPRIRAIAVDAVYDDPADFLHLQVNRTGLGALPLVQTFSRWGFHLVHWKHRKDTPLRARLAALAEVPKMFIRPLDDPVLGESTLQLFLIAPEPRQQDVAPRGGYVGMLDADKRGYENRVVGFFLTYIPPASR